MAMYSNKRGDIDGNNGRKILTEFRSNRQGRTDMRRAESKKTICY